MKGKGGGAGSTRGVILAVIERTETGPALEGKNEGTNSVRRLPCSLSLLVDSIFLIPRSGRSPVFF